MDKLSTDIHSLHLIRSVLQNRILEMNTLYKGKRIRIDYYGSGTDIDYGEIKEFTLENNLITMRVRLDSGWCTNLRHDMHKVTIHES